jgi:hypothetical protein
MQFSDLASAVGVFHLEIDTGAVASIKLSPTAAESGTIDEYDETPTERFLAGRLGSVASPWLFPSRCPQGGAGV